MLTDFVVANHDMITTVLAQMPGQSINPQAPGDLGVKFERLLNFAQYLAFGVAIIGVITAGASWALSRREGSSEEATSRAIAIGIGCAVIGGAGGIVSMLAS